MFAAAAAHPSLAVLCGGQELEEQPAMLGLDRERWEIPLVTKVRPRAGEPRRTGRAVRELVPVGRAPSRSSRTTGSATTPASGCSPRSLDDLRRAAPRFVSEGLAFSIPPEPTSVDELLRRSDAAPGTTRRGSAPSTTTPVARGTWRTCATTTSRRSSTSTRRCSGGPIPSGRSISVGRRSPT